MLQMLHQQQQQQLQQQHQQRLLDCMEDRAQQGTPQPTLQQPQPGLPQLPPSLQQRKHQGLAGAAYPWGGVPQPHSTPGVQQAWNAAQEPVDNVSPHPYMRPCLYRLIAIEGGTRLLRGLPVPGSAICGVLTFAAGCQSEANGQGAGRHGLALCTPCHASSTGAAAEVRQG